MNNWVSVFRAEAQHRAEIVKAVLLDNDIEAVIVNRKESIYKLFGTHDVYVNPDKVMKALKLISEDIQFE